MKNLFFIIVTISLLVGCSSEKNETAKKDISNKEKSIVEKNDNKIKKSLKYGFQLGNSYKYKLTTVIENSQHVESDTTLSSDLKQTVEYTFNLNVDKIDQNEIAEISVYSEAIKAEAFVNGETVKYDSKFLYSSREQLIFADYEAMKNRAYSVRVSKHGQIFDIFEVDSIIDEILRIKAGNNKISAEERETFKQQFINTGLAPLTEQLFRSTSKEDVSINSSWEQRYPSYLVNFQIENIATFRVAEFLETDSDSLAKINASLSVNWDGENQITEEGVKYTFSDPNISGSGVIYFNLGKGVVQSSETTVKMEMIMNLESYDANNKLVKAFKRDFMLNQSKLELI
jgi:uncharacterized protein YcfL